MTHPRGVVSRFANLLIEEIERIPVRADGALNHRDFYDALKEALARYEDGQESNTDTKAGE